MAVDRAVATIWTDWWVSPTEAVENGCYRLAVENKS